MCHPPARESDLGFEDFMSDVVAALREGRRVGIKLDFKEIECVAPCVDLRARDARSGDQIRAASFARCRWAQRGRGAGAGGTGTHRRARISCCVRRRVSERDAEPWMDAHGHPRARIHDRDGERDRGSSWNPSPRRRARRVRRARLRQRQPGARALIDGIVNNDSTGVHDRSFTLWGPAPRPCAEVDRERAPGGENLRRRRQRPASAGGAVIRAYAHSSGAGRAHDAYVHARAR